MLTASFFRQNETKIVKSKVSLHVYLRKCYFPSCGWTISATIGYFLSNSHGLSIPRLRVIFEPPAAISQGDGYTFLRSTFLLYLFRP